MSVRAIILFSIKRLVNDERYLSIHLSRLINISRCYWILNKFWWFINPSCDFEMLLVKLILANYSKCIQSNYFCSITLFNVDCLVVVRDTQGRRLTGLSIGREMLSRCLDYSNVQEQSDEPIDTQDGGNWLVH